jgi:WD40 repeat protein
MFGLPKDMRVVAIHPTQPNIIFAGALQGGVYRSPDGGVSWSTFKTGMEPNDPILALAINPDNPNILWAGSRATGIYRWVPAEGRWTHVNSGLSTRSVQALAISPDGQVLYAASSGEGIFRIGEVEVERWNVMLPLVIR